MLNIYYVSLGGGGKRRYLRHVNNSRDIRGDGASGAGAGVGTFSRDAKILTFYPYQFLGSNISDERRDFGSFISAGVDRDMCHANIGNPFHFRMFGKHL